MLEEENRLVQNFCKKNKDQVLRALNDLFEASRTLSPGEDIGPVKSYFQGINFSIYTVLYTSRACKVNLYSKRNIFKEKIDKAGDLDELKDVARDMVLAYYQIRDLRKESCSHPVIVDALDYIHSNLEKDLSLKVVAHRVHVSKNYLSFLFSKYVGMSFSDYINKLRVEKAKVLLKNKDLSLLDVSLECGFNSQSYFCSIFKKFESISPRRYQQNQ